MIRMPAVAAAVATLALAAIAPAGAASAQTWGQPVYLNAWGRPVGGTPLSEVETRSYVRTGLWADGYSDRPQVYIPAPGYGSPHSGQGYGRQVYGDRGHGLRGYGHSAGRRSFYSNYRGRYDAPSRPGYRDEWGYNDDRPPSTLRGWNDRRRRPYDRDCGCGDVYLYDR